MGFTRYCEKGGEESCVYKFSYLEPSINWLGGA